MKLLSCIYIHIFAFINLVISTFIYLTKPHHKDIIKKEEVTNMDYGTITLNLDKLIKEKGISKTQLSYRAEVSHTQINKFCKNEIARIDLATIARLCTVLDCDVNELLVFHNVK